MAHFAKYKASALGNMCAHYERSPELERGYQRINIDPERTNLNYNLAEHQQLPPVQFINERIASLNLKRAPRKDAVRMCDCVLTMPQSLDPTLRDEFFSASYGELAAKFGEENVVSCWVHLDESQPHMHFAWVPVTEDGRLSAKDVLNRNVLQRFHVELQANLERVLNCSVDVLLDEKTRGDKAAKYVDLDEFKAATERLESLRREVKEAERESATQTITASARTLRDAPAREEQLRSEISELRERINDTQQQVAKARERVTRLETTKERLQAAVSRLARKAAKLMGQFRQIAALEYCSPHVRAHMQSIREFMIREPQWHLRTPEKRLDALKPKLDRTSVESLAASATKIAQERNAQRQTHQQRHHRITR